MLTSALWGVYWHGAFDLDRFPFCCICPLSIFGQGAVLSVIIEAGKLRQRKRELASARAALADYRRRWDVRR